MTPFRQAACGLAVLFASIATSSAQAPPTSAPAAAPSPAAGLDSLNDQRLIADLANRGLSNLLDRALDVNNVPPSERDALKTLTALRQLNDPKARLTPQQRQQIVQNVARGIEAALPGLTDPQTMMQQATALLQFGVEREANTLEYWGDNPKTQAALRPVVEAVVKLLDKAAAEAQKKADALANTITGPNDPKAKQWEDAANVATSAAYTRHMVDYYRALAYDRVAPQRQQITEEAIKFLSQYDNADSSVQPIVRLRIAKLHMLRGEFDQAKELLASVAAAKDIAPAPDAGQQWEARYFSAMCDLLAKKPEDAQKALTELTAWQTANLPKDQSTRDGAVAACVMLQYRIESLRADTATTDAAKKEATDRAVALLIDLVKKRPDLQGVIFEQLMSKLPADVDLKTLDPLLLQGLVVRADEERQRPENEKIDVAVIRRGIDAAQEMIRRKAQVDPQLLDASTLLLGFLHERLGEHAAAAEALLDYLANVPTASPQNQQIALDNALAIIARLRADAATADAPATVHAYERFLPIAIKPPFNRREFAFEYARRLQLQGKSAEAVEYFRLVPPDDKRLAQARFYQMVALQQRLDDEKLSPPERAQVVDEIGRLVDEVSTQISSAMNAATTEPQRTQYRSMLVRTLLLAADLARREQNDPKRTLARLQNFESVAAGLPNEKELLGTALYTRVQAYMALGDSNSATQTLVALLKARPGGEGAAIVYKLLQKLNEELDQARTAGDKARMKQLATNRAQLSGFLVDWAKNNPDPNINKFTYRYSVFDAATKHLAADLEDDPARRKAELQAALKLYEKLESPESAALYQATLDPASAEAKAHEPDPAVSLGIGLIAFDLGDYAEAQKRLGALLTARKLGTPTITVEQNGGESKQIENDQYWEATLKLMRSNVVLAAANPSDATAQAAKTETINYLKQLYIRYGRDVGGKKWSPEFEKLRKEIAPEINPDDFKLDGGAAPTTTAPTQPNR